MQKLSDIVEIKLEDLKPEEFIEQQVKDIKAKVGDGVAINALSGGVDSSVVTLLGHRALGKKLRTVFIDSGIMREGEPERVVSLFKELGVEVEIIDAKAEFFGALKGLTDPEEKREAVTQTFYKTVFGRIVRESKAKYLLQGTNFTDVEETVAGIKRQHNILEQLGIDTKKEFGYKVIEPIIQLRKSGVRKVGKILGLQKVIYDSPPFPGPALATRVIGEVTPERVATVRKATVIVEQELREVGAFQYLAILHEDRVTGIRDKKRDFGLQIEVRCWDSTDAVHATPTNLPFEKLTRLANRITAEVPGVVSVTYNLATKPPSTIEAI
ncbi:MAG: ExsB family transcriptional regulator [Methanomassiliicoccales archaeon]|nr:ExsB family transcriptional regulator [Methanomassiliicoccales archaeon]NYT15453.1 ExsB family transcriptional regulator [Methanomassiliicoccales archaeon]